MGSENRERDEIAFDEGMRLLKAKRYDEAVERLHEAATTGEDRPMEHYALAVARYKAREWQGALESARRFLDMSPEDNQYTRQTRAILPVLEERLGRETPEAGEPEAEQVPALEKSASYEAALEAYLRGDYEDAVDGFLEAVDEFPDNPHVRNNLGLAYLAQREYPRAVEQFERALEIAPDFLEARNNLGLAWTDYGANRARECWEAVLERDPCFFDSLMNLAALHYRRGEFSQARVLWRRAAEIRPEDPQVRRNLKLRG